MKQLKNKVALISGGSRGIGAAIVERLARDGANVALTYVSNAEQANQVVEKAKALGVKAIAIPADAADPKAVTSAVTQTVAKLGSIDILVNNAGVSLFAPVDEFSMADFEHTFAINVRSVFVATQEAIKHMKDGGRIINIGSAVTESLPSVGGSVYTMSKSALIGLTKGMARDLGARGITVNNVHPGPIDTDMNPEDAESSAEQLNNMVLPHFGTADDIAAMVAFVASPDAEYMTGANLAVDGGFTV